MSKFLSAEEFKKEIESCLDHSKTSRFSDSFEDFLLHGKNIADESRLEFIIQSEPDDEYSGECFTIIKLDGVMYKLTYVYRSHYGYDFDYFGFYKVKPVERTVTFYDFTVE